MFDALNVVYDEDEKRGFIKLNFQAATVHAWRAVVPFARSCGCGRGTGRA